VMMRGALGKEVPIGRANQVASASPAFRKSYTANDGYRDAVQFSHHKSRCSRKFIGSGNHRRQECPSVLVVLPPIIDQWRHARDAQMYRK
jgi:hypothetical protein